MDHTVQSKLSAIVRRQWISYGGDHQTWVHTAGKQHNIGRKYRHRRNAQNKPDKISRQWKKKLSTSNSIKLKLRKQLVRLSLYGNETRALGKQEKNSIKGFEFWRHRRMLKIPRVAGITHEDILQRRTGTSPGPRWFFWERESSPGLGPLSGRRAEYTGMIHRVKKPSRDSLDAWYKSLNAIPT